MRQGLYLYLFVVVACVSSHHDQTAPAAPRPSEPPPSDSTADAAAPPTTQAPVTTQVPVSIPAPVTTQPPLTAQPPRELDEPVAPPDPAALAQSIPPQGRSLFDHLMAKTAADGVVALTVPFPFEDLVAAVTAKASSPVAAALIPKGRSLLRAANAAAPFRFPRVLVAPTSEPPFQTAPTTRSAPTIVGGRIFLAYVEPAERIEVISYNEAIGRYEFQVVTGYAEGKTPVVKYANRAICVACHQGGGPLFPEYTWAETNMNAYVGKILLNEQGTATYHGLPLVNPPLFSGVKAMDATVRASHVDLALQQVWAKGCGSDVDAAVACRGAILQRALGKILALTPQPEAERPAAWTDDFRGLAEEALGPSSGLADPTGKFPAAFIADEAADLAAIKQQILAYKDFNGALDPLARREKNRFFDNEVETLLRSDGFTQIVDYIGRQFNAADRQVLAAALTGDGAAAKFEGAVRRVEQRTRDGATDALAARAPARGVIMAELVAALGGHDDRPLCCAASAPPFPAPILEGADAGSLPPGLAPMAEYCAGCHTAPPYAFLAGSSAEVAAALIARKADILRRLTLPDGDPQAMPPGASSQRQGLLKPESVGKLLEMQIGMQSL